jgi:hypothetical protein
MRNIKVVVQGEVKGTYSQDKVVAAMRAGSMEGATFFDAQGGGLVTPDELRSGSLMTKPWDGSEPAHAPTSRYQRMAMEENNRETKNLHANPYTIGQDGYTSRPGAHYSRQIGGAPESYGLKSNPNTPWGGIAAVVAALVFWPLGLALGIRARNEAKRSGHSATLANAAIVISFVGAAVLTVMIVNANIVRV